MESAEPDWDMTPYFPEFGGRVYRDFWEELERDIAALDEQISSAGPIDAGSRDGWAALLCRMEQTFMRARHLGSYLGCLSSADSRDQAIQGDSARASGMDAELQKLYVAVRARLRELDDAGFQALVADERLADASYFLSRLRKRALWSMEQELETLAADLGVTGIRAWGRLYDQVSGKLELTLEVEGREPKNYPVAMTRTLLEDPDAAVRDAALKGANAAWAGMADVTAACLNSISGTRLELQRRRGMEHFLDGATFDAGISRKTLQVMLDTVASRAEVPRRYLRGKARLMGKERLGFQDLMAPLPLSGGAQAARIGWDDGRERILEAFGSFYPDLREFAQEVFDSRWIDHAPRAGKRPGGFCTGSKLIGQPRIFCTYNGALGDLVTVAHELGHAWHSRLLRETRPWASGYPMTLAETASTFAQSLVIDAVLDSDSASADERLTMLDGRMQDAEAFLLNIPMRFEFEHNLYEERKGGELSVDRLCELMEQAQKNQYGDALDPAQLNPYFWASKLHFYITSVSFYNFPYTFGYLFSTGIIARARQHGPSFLPRYEELLRLTGSASAEDVAMQSLGVDLTKPDFWNASIDLIEADLHRFEDATG